MQNERLRLVFATVHQEVIAIRSTMAGSNFSLMAWRQMTIKRLGSEQLTRGTAFFLVLSLAYVVWAYRSTLLDGGLAFDDWYHIEHMVHSSFTERLVAFSPTNFQYQAMGNLQWWVYWRLFGLNPFPYHVTAIVLHGAATLMLFVTARRLGIGQLGSTFTAFVFAVHPAIFDTVVWVSPSTEHAFALSFLLASLLLYLRALEMGGESRWWYVILSALPYLLAIKSKMQAVFSRPS